MGSRSLQDGTIPSSYGKISWTQAIEFVTCGRIFHPQGSVLFPDGRMASPHAGTPSPCVAEIFTPVKRLETHDSGFMPCGKRPGTDDFMFPTYGGDCGIDYKPSIAPAPEAPRKLAGGEASLRARTTGTHRGTRPAPEGAMEANVPQGSSAPTGAGRVPLMGSGGSGSQTRFTTEAADGNREAGGRASRLISAAPPARLIAFVVVHPTVPSVRKKRGFRRMAWALLSLSPVCQFHDTQKTRGVCRAAWCLCQWLVAAGDG